MPAKKVVCLRINIYLRLRLRTIIYLGVDPAQCPLPCLHAPITNVLKFDLDIDSENGEGQEMGSTSNTSTVRSINRKKNMYNECGTS